MRRFAHLASIALENAHLHTSLQEELQSAYAPSPRWNSRIRPWKQRVQSARTNWQR